jgi:hypothetical protein
MGDACFFPPGRPIWLLTVLLLAAAPEPLARLVRRVLFLMLSD